MPFDFVYIWRTLPPFKLQTVFWGTRIPGRTACLFSYWGGGGYISEFVLSQLLFNNPFNYNWKLSLIKERETYNCCDMVARYFEA